MYLTLVASDPRTPPATLRAAAASPGLHDTTAALLLRHPALPDDARIPDDLELPTGDVHDALTDPTLTSGARRRLLNHGETARWNLEHFTDLTPAEVDDEHTRHHIFSVDQASRYLRHPATSPRIAQQAVDWVVRYARNGVDELELATYALERGAVPPAPDLYSSRSVRRLARARKRAPQTSWAEHLRATLDPDSAYWTTVAAATTDPAVARAALSAAERTSDPDAAMFVYAKVANNPRLPDDVRVPALTKVGGDRSWFTTSYANGYLSDAGARVFAQAAPPGAANTVATLATVNQTLSATTLDHLWAVRSAHIEPRTQLLLALHPNASVDLQRTVRDAVSAHEDVDILDGEWCDALTVLQARLSGPTAVLDLPVRLLEEQTSTEADQRRAVTALLARAVGALPVWVPRPETLTAALAIEDGFSGTVRELLTAADAVTA